MNIARFVAICVFLIPAAAHAGDKKLPNILWITSEDHGPHLGCYGDTFATTPNLDKLAAKGMLYKRCWSNAPVCAPARTTIISGLYPTSTGSEHMRSITSLPKNFAMYPTLLRALGYYCTNNVKEDYNLTKDGKVWNDSSAKAHYKNRANGQPFFAVFNFTQSHESQLRNKKKAPTHDVAKVAIPAYHPDTPEVRHEWATYYDNITIIDSEAGKILKELADLGLLEDTIVFFYADHGSGMPRNKRTPYNSGLHVPFIVHFPEKYKHLAPPEYKSGGKSDRLISFVDLAPTLLSLAGSKAPEWMQGTAFAGSHIGKANEYLHGFRGRMDERYDFVRSATDGRYVYVRNYLPHLPAGQHTWYQFETKTTQVWKDLFDKGKLNAAQATFWGPRAAEDLFDLEYDPYEVKSLASSKEHAAIVEKFRKVVRDQALRVRDVGFLPEEEIHSRSKDSTPYEMGHDAKRYPLDRILKVIDASDHVDHALQDPDSAVRYWAAVRYLGEIGKGPVTETLPLLDDSAPNVRIVAAELAVRTSDAQRKEGLNILIDLATPGKHSLYVTLAALNTLDNLGNLARPGAEAYRAWLKLPESNHRSAYGIPRLVNRLAAKFE